MQPGLCSTTRFCSALNAHFASTLVVLRHLMVCHEIDGLGKGKRHCRLHHARLGKQYRYKILWYLIMRLCKYLGSTLKF